MTNSNSPGHAKAGSLTHDLDEAGRPHAPPIPGATDLHRRQGRHLAAIHRMHLRDIAEISGLVARIDSDTSAPGQLVDKVQALAVTRNIRTFGTLCGGECNRLLFHHDAEEQHVFPILEQRGSDGLRAVVAKLRQEHEVIHTLLEQLAIGARRVLSEPDASAYGDLRATFTALETALRSHFHYEETELEEALGVHDAL
ncbi:hemerythrin domain-containing protein [Pseudooceanicola sediminis]|uniref:Hemerythrin domain-containing protein n=1 Tax=Pseudooceanicola sediminis TaxID=2211117 RepID=A0A399IZE1_9RHOB|nr:hemerythrin domain-containing protein [Pseudooceanicola sediminis]KAA2312961.1 hemerythrin domain-containing protein [Puniceibacterium sp. HSS470]RII37639.1 hemerythrin domain-containing protein [Pseudooceanicola sediminis]|tara:strand:+ start:9390 stop:9983 length:594 start_codon:yes stop_codon:yes gene_type:complete